MELVVRPRPERDESLSGFILRVSQENWFSRIGTIEELTQVRVPKIALQDGGLDLLAYHLRMKPAELEAYQYAPITATATIRRFFGSEVHQSHLLTTSMRYCPVCLGVKRYHQAIWELRMVGACPEHGVRLLSQDPIHGKPISWQRPDLFAMPWGDLPVADTRGHRADLQDDVLVGQRALYEKCGLKPGGSLLLGQMPDEIGSMSLDEFLKLIIVLGASKLRTAGFSGGRPIYVNGVDMLDLSSAGTLMLMDWPAGFFKYLEEERASADFTSTALSTLFEDLFRRMKKLEAGPAKGFLQHATNAYLSERPISIKRKNANFVRADEQNRWSYVTLQQAANILNVTTYRARIICEEQGWIEAGKKNRHVPNLIPRELVEAYSEPEPVTCSHTDAMELLGTAKSGLQAIIKQRLLVPRTNKVDYRSDTRFIRSEVEDLVMRLCTATGAGAPTVAEEVNILQLSRLMQPPRHSIGLLLALVLEGTLQPLRWDKETIGIYAMRFDASRVSDYRSAVNRVMPPTIEAGSAVGRYGYGLEELRWLTAEGLIRVVRSAPAFVDNILDRRSLDSFFGCHLMSSRVDVERLGVIVTLVAESSTHGRVYRIG